MSHPLQAEGAPTRIESRPMRKLAFLLPLLVACQTATPPSADTMSTPPATTTPAAPVVADRSLIVKADTPARLAQLGLRLDTTSARLHLVGDPPVSPEII